LFSVPSVVTEFVCVCVCVHACVRVLRIAESLEVNAKMVLSVK